MANVETEQAFYIEKREIPQDSDEEYNYEEIPVDEDFTSVIDEDLDTALRIINEAHGTVEVSQTRPPISEKSSLIIHPETVDDYVRNFLARMGMQRTLESFQSEWYELQQKGLLKQDLCTEVPTVYSQNSELETEARFLKREMLKFKNAAEEARDAYVKLKKERDYHRMHHKRVVQEKNKLINDIKQLKNHYSSYEPTLRQLKTKYETAMKEKMLSKLEKDRALGQVTGLQNTLKNIEALKDVTDVGGTKNNSLLRLSKKGYEATGDANGLGPTQRALLEERRKIEAEMDAANSRKRRHEKDTEFPTDSGINPNLIYAKNAPGHLTRTGGYRLSSTFQSNNLAVSSIALHPRKQIIATTSDDHTWKMWSIPSGDLVMTGEGHTDWVSSCDFHPSGGKLATGSGDTTVKIWDFSKASCMHTFLEHTHAVWGVSWHSCGDFLATCSMDNTSKIWDLNSLRCRYTLRGHTDSVNGIQYVPFSNTVLTCSADKTLSLWDTRTGLCAQTFYGHTYSVNSASFNPKGDTVASIDSYGNLKLFDVRTLSQLASVDVGPHPGNHVAFDSSSQLLSIASNDSTIKMYEVATNQITTLIGHEDAVQATVFDRAGEFLVSAASDCTVRIWS